MTVDEYLKGQETIKFEKAQDAYLELMQNLADVAFTILLETGLSESTKTKTLEKWMDLGSQLPDILVAEIGKEWINYLMLPEIDIDDPVLFIETHNDFLQSIAQDKFGSMNSNEEVHKACVVMMASALYLATSIGANPKNLAEHWVETAKNHGAKE
jgi:hypothetical protein